MIVRQFKKKIANKHIQHVGLYVLTKIDFDRLDGSDVDINEYIYSEISFIMKPYVRFCSQIHLEFTLFGYHRRFTRKCNVTTLRKGYERFEDFLRDQYERRENTFKSYDTFLKFHLESGGILVRYVTHEDDFRRYGAPSLKKDVLQSIDVLQYEEYASKAKYIHSEDVDQNKDPEYSVAEMDTSFLILLNSSFDDTILP